MATVCTQCFVDKELVAFISSQGTMGDCQLCGSKSVVNLPTEELHDFFSELMHHFKPDHNGTRLLSLIQGNWSLFSNLSVGASLLNLFLSKIKSQFPHADALVSFSDDILENVKYWDILKSKLITQSRYITDVNYLTDELGWDGFFSSRIEINPGTTLYRARLHYKSGEPAFALADMFCPPAALSPAGRANPAGIPYLYLSDNEETVLYETRATYLDELSIGTFQVKTELDQPLLVSDFTAFSTIFHPSKIGDKIKATLLKQKISSDLSKPMRRYDSELDYIPTQFICEFIKIYTGVNGIKFRSSLHTTGNNFVIFDQRLMSCTGVKQAKIHKVEILA